MKILSFLNGWKSVVGFLGINLAAGHVLVIDAALDAISNPNPQSIGNVVAQLLLLVGLSHKVVKEVNK